MQPPPGCFRCQPKDGGPRIYPEIITPLVCADFAPLDDKRTETIMKTFAAGHLCAISPHILAVKIICLLTTEGFEMDERLLPSHPKFLQARLKS